MSRHYRRALFWSFLFLFLTTAPLLILYTAGYRYNWQRGKVQETGVLTLNYRPRTAEVQLNEERHSEKPPLRLTRLIPGRYTIAVEEEGYHAWKKRLWVEPSKTTFAEHMVLWKKDGTRTALNDDAPLLTVSSPENDVLAISEKKEPRRITIRETTSLHKTQTITLPEAKGVRIATMLWSPRGRRLFIEDAAGKQFVASRTNENDTPLALDRFVAGRLLNVQWNSSSDDQLYGYQKISGSREYELIAIDLFRGKTQRAALSPLQRPLPYTVEDDLLYRVDKAVLTITSFTESRQALERRLPLPLLPSGATPVQFLSNGPEAITTLFDAGERRLILLDKETRTLYPIQETIDGVVAAAWSPKHNRLLWNTGKALWLLDLERSTRELLVDESASGGKKIHAMAWDPENEYVFYAAGDAINVIEVDNRDERNRVTLMTIPDATGLTVARDGNTIFVRGRVNDAVKELFAIEISER